MVGIRGIKKITEDLYKLFSDWCSWLYRNYYSRKIIEEGHTCTVIDNLSTGSKEHIPAGCKFIFGDVSYSQIIDSLADEKFDCIMHIAGQNSVKLVLMILGMIYIQTHNQQFYC